MSESLENTKDIDAVDENGWTALHRAAEKGDVYEVERLLGAGAVVDARSAAHSLFTTPLIIAIRYERFDVMRLLLDRGADIDACDGLGYGNENTPCNFNGSQVDAVVLRCMCWTVEDY